MNKKIMILALAACQITALSAFGATSKKKAVADDSYTCSQTPLEKWWNGDYLTGDWFGVRTDLEKNDGVRFYGNWETELAYNPSGGNKSGGFLDVNSFEFGAEFDLNKIAGLKGASIFTRAVYRTGYSLTDAGYIGNSVYNVQQISSGMVNQDSKYFLQDFYFQQKFLDKQNLTWKIGRMTASDDFAGSPIYGLYMNNGIDGNIKGPFVTGLFSSYPGSVWGSMINYDAPNKEWYVRGGVYQSDNRIYSPTNNDHGVDFGVRDGDGVQFIAEGGWTPANLLGKGMGGHYFLGAYGITADLPDYAGNTKDFSYGVYVHADQMVYQSVPGTDQGLTLWAVFAYSAPEDVQLLPYHVAGGAVYKGLIPCRPNDYLVFGFIYGSYSSDFTSNSPVATYGTQGEEVLEVGYKVQFNKFFWMQPNIQYIIDPNGRNSNQGGHDALVLGCRIGATF